MSDYLSRAADRAGGTNAAIRPALPSVFEPEKGIAENATVPLGFSETRSNAEVEHPGNSPGERLAGTVSEIQERVTSVLALAPEPPNEQTKSIIDQKFGDVVLPRVRGGATESELSPGTPPSAKSSALRTERAQSIPWAGRSAELKESSPHSRVMPADKGAASSSELSSEAPSSAEPSVLRPERARSIPRAGEPADPKDWSPHSPLTRADKGAASSVQLPSERPEPIGPKIIEPARKDSFPAVPVSAILRPRAASFRSAEPRKPVRSADHESRSESERTIHVTIGRLEVRAVQSASPSPKSAPPKPRISLAEYLRSRNGGNR